MRLNTRLYDARAAGTLSSSAADPHSRPAQRAHAALSLRGRVAGIGAMLAFTVFWTAAFAQFERRSIGSWTLVFGKDRSGRLSCRAETQQGGLSLGVNGSSDGLWLIGVRDIRSSNRTLTPEEVVVSVDGKEAWRTKAEGISGFVAFLRLGVNPHPVPLETLSAGRSLTLKARRDSFTFDLAGFSAVGEAMRTCLAPRS